MAKNPLLQLAELGQSFWLDYIKRDLFTTGPGPESGGSKPGQ